MGALLERYPGTSDHPNPGSWDFVTAADANAAFRSIVAPSFAGWTQRKPRSFVRRLADGVNGIVELQPLKGGSYRFCWGVSLSCVPTRWENSVAWHRTLKSSRLDLFEFSSDVAEREAAGVDVRDTVWRQKICGDHGVAHLIDDLGRTWRWAEPRAESFLESCSTLAGALAIAEAQVARRSLGHEDIHYPRPELVIAFLRAQLGDRLGAGEALDAYIERDMDSLSEPAKANLRAALRVVRASAT